MLQLWPALLSAVDMTAKPRESAASFSTSGAEPAWRSIPQLAPCVIRSLWFHCVCGSQAVHGLEGSYSTAILYWSRSW